jgi:hypothetical protein
MHILLHIWTHGKYQLNWHPWNVIKSCLGPNNSNEEKIPFCKYGQMDECGLCFTQHSVRALCNIKKSWAILRFDSRHNISGEGCDYKFNTKKIRCVMCDCMWASFNTSTLHLQPLPIMGRGGYLRVNNINKSWNNFQI